MAKEWKVTVHSPGIQAILKDALMRSVVNAAAYRVADAAGTSIPVAEYTTDREAASVAVAADQQAKYGTLTRAAASVGLEVRTP